jgi:hypothetical protein
MTIDACDAETSVQHVYVWHGDVGTFQRQSKPVNTLQIRAKTATNIKEPKVTLWHELTHSTLG